MLKTTCGDHQIFLQCRNDQRSPSVDISSIKPLSKGTRDGCAKRIIGLKYFSPFISCAHNDSDGRRGIVTPIGNKD